MLIGRNDPCPCGSGMKYKKCCLSKAYVEKGEGKEDAVREKVVQDLLKFFNENFADSLADARDIFWSDFVPEKHLDDETLPLADINFWEWVVHDYLIDEEDEKTLIDLYMESGSKISINEHRVLSMMKNSVISLYEVQEVFPDKGLLLKDLLLGGEYDVREKAATKSVRKWDIFATRLLYVDGIYIMSGAVYPYHLKQKEWILEDVHATFEDYKNDFPDDAIDVFLKTNSDLFNFNWYYPIQNPPQLNLATTSGEPMLFSKAPIEAAKSFKDSPPDGPEDKIPMEVQQQIYSQFMQKHCENWLNEKIPALDGKTPRQAVKTADGRRRVTELLKSFENIEEHNEREGRPFYNLSWMWDSLGVKRET